MKLKLSIYLKELILFGSTMFLGVFAAHKYSSLLVFSRTESPSMTFEWPDVLIFAGIIAAVLFLMKKVPKLFKAVLVFFLLLIVFMGSQIIGGLAFKSPFDLAFGFFVTALFLTVGNVFMYNLGMILGLAGITGVLGISIDPQVAIIMLVIFSVYDILAVYWTGHMVAMARGMIESGAIFGFIIPFDFNNFFHNKKSARERIGEDFMILGSGDVGLPLIMASSVAAISLWQGMFVALFSLVGLFFTHLIFHNQKERKPMAALPPIATMTIIGYLVSLLIF